MTSRPSSSGGPCGRGSLPDEPDSQAEGLLALAEVLALAGRVAEAAATARDALGLFEAKGNVISEARSRRVLEDLEQRLPR